MVRALDWRSKGQEFESRQLHKRNKVFPSQKGYADSLSVCPTPVCIRMHTKDQNVKQNIWYVLLTYVDIFSSVNPCNVQGCVDDMIQDIVDCIQWIYDKIHDYGGDKVCSI